MISYAILCYLMISYDILCYLMLSYDILCDVLLQALDALLIELNQLLEQALMAST